MSRTGRRAYFWAMTTSLSAVARRAAGRGLLAAMALAGLPGCQEHRLAQLEATQRQQAQELADLRRQLAEKQAEVTQLETCVDDLENAVYDPEQDSADYADADRSATTQL